MSDDLKARARELAKTLGVAHVTEITEALRAAYDAGLKAAEEAVRAEFLHEPNPDSEGDQGYTAGVEDSLRAISALRSTTGEVKP